jgi:hypothetical protein
MTRVRSITLGGLLVAVACNLALAAGQRNEAEGCSALSNTEAAGPPQAEEVQLSPSELAFLKTRRACLKTYSSGFPGGEGALLKARASELRADLATVEHLFDSKVNPLHESDLQYKRRLHILGGWDRDQVLLWGNYYYLRRLYEEGQFSRIHAELARLHSRFGLDDMTPPRWDAAEYNTYFSKEALRGMIRLLDLQVRATEALAKSDSPHVRVANNLAAELLAQGAAMAPFFKFAPNPAEDILKLCRHGTTAAAK